jgi:ParB family chromosome partitioning protein
MTKANKGGLGKGLKALLASEELEWDIDGDKQVLGSVAEIPISQIEANPFQPRTEFEQKALEELSESIKIHGIIQPVTVRKMGYEKYQLISGERRTRAAILAGLQSLPAYIRVANDQDMLEMALIENIQRENLNAIEIAISYKRLMEECELKQDELGDRVGKDRSTVANYMRLLKLPHEIQVAIKNNELSMGHARTILGLKEEQDQLDLYHRILQEGLSVRATENVVKEHSAGKSKSPNQKVAANMEYHKIVEAYTNKMPQKIKLKTGKGNKANVIIQIGSAQELAELMNKLSS